MESVSAFYVQSLGHLRIENNTWLASVDIRYSVDTLIIVMAKITL